MQEIFKYSDKMSSHNPPERVLTVGYIGLGNAGFSMASNLPKKGYKLVVHDADDTKSERAAKEWDNTTASGGQPDAFASCEIVITMLPQGKIVREVLLGSNGIAKALQPGSLSPHPYPHATYIYIYIDMNIWVYMEAKERVNSDSLIGTIVVDTSSSSPFDTKSLGQELGRHQLHLIDCPITQTYMHATDAGESTAMVGSDSTEAFETVRPVLDCMFSYIFHMGPLGSGHAMKTLNNYIMASSISALCDSLVTGQKFGLDPQQMIDVLNVGTGVCFPTLDTFRRDGVTQRYNSGFGLALLVKDLRITKEFMEHNGFQTELPDLLQRNLQYSLDQVEPDADHTKCLPGWEKRSGVKLKKTEQVEDIAKEDFEHRLRGLNRPA